MITLFIILNSTLIKVNLLHIQVSTTTLHFNVKTIMWFEHNNSSNTSSKRCRELYCHLCNHQRLLNLGDYHDMSNRLWLRLCTRSDGFSDCTSIAFCSHLHRQHHHYNIVTKMQNVMLIQVIKIIINIIVDNDNNN